jgi:hypothetical protein
MLKKFVELMRHLSKKLFVEDKPQFLGAPRANNKPQFLSNPQFKFMFIEPETRSGKSFPPLSKQELETLFGSPNENPKN